jgi:hypothetical protein
MFAAIERSAQPERQQSLVLAGVADVRCLAEGVVDLEQAVLTRSCFGKQL